MRGPMMTLALAALVISAAGCPAKTGGVHAPTPSGQRDQAAVIADMLGAIADMGAAVSTVKTTADIERRRAALEDAAKRMGDLSVEGAKMDVSGKGPSDVTKRFKGRMVAAVRGLETALKKLDPDARTAVEAMIERQMKRGAEVEAKLRERHKGPRAKE